jgi:site-specific recombinase XerD
MLNLNVGEFTIQNALGHSNIETTKVYAQVQNEGLQDSLEKLAKGGIDHSAIIRPSDKLLN